MSTQYRFTVDDLEHLPFDDKRYEVIEGELYVTTAPHSWHQMALYFLIITLGNWNERTASGRVIPGPGLIFSPEDAVIPDLVWISKARLPLVMDDEGKIRAAPDLVVEVVSPGLANEARDRETKLRLYSRWGVLEYWIVDYLAQRVQIFRRTGGQLQLAVTLTASDELTSPLLSDFTTSVSSLFLSRDNGS